VFKEEKRISCSIWNGQSTCPNLSKAH